MKTAASVVLAASALASAGVTYNATTGEYICSRPNSQWCAGDSFGTDIIIRCNSSARGQPGRCGDNLAGQFPVGVNPALCWQSNADAGNAACEKNCVVYAADGSFRLPPSVCTPYATSSGLSLPTVRPTGSSRLNATSGVQTPTFRPTTPVVPRPSGTGNLTGGGRNATTVRSGSTSIFTPPRPTGTGSGGPRTNGTAPTNTQGPAPGTPSQPGVPGQPSIPGQPGQTSATRTPVGPSGTPSLPPTVPTAGAAHNAAGYIAVVGIVAAYFL
ncbi:hypothetical protein CMUS01_09216 [Colletotrichum musicola]|uniref:Accumulation-associated protein n=1 Tax=Colletotrichum musicola TaxID=2175873 RepID=A0A8H6K9I6_9PEZI|nr:hypothetical protein CMUS01_09216 [Colletotrichum musicola]